MNLKKTITSLFAVTAIVGSMLAPASAEDPSRTVTGNVSDDGEITFGFTGNPITFNATVDANTSDDVGPLYRGFTYSDTYSYSPGFNLQISVDDLKTADGQYHIDHENLKIGKRAPGPGGTLCPNINVPVPGGNSRQKITMLSTHVPNTTPLSGPVVVITGSTGAGCGTLPTGADLGVSYFLHVPAGTFTNSTTAVYTANLTLTNTVAPAPPAP